MEKPQVKRSRHTLQYRAAHEKRLTRLGQNELMRRIENAISQQCLFNRMSSILPNDFGILAVIRILNRIVIAFLFVASISGIPFHSEQKSLTPPMDLFALIPCILFSREKGINMKNNDHSFRFTTSILFHSSFHNQSTLPQ